MTNNPTNDNMQEYWQKGEHHSYSEGDIKISEMKTGHIKNTIAYYKKFNCDTSILEQELTKRTK